jgi:hypothetical protein
LAGGVEQLVMLLRDLERTRLPRLVVEKGDSEFCAGAAERFRAVLRDRVLVGNADNQRLLPASIGS